MTTLDADSGAEFAARRSGRVSTGKFAADHDTWQENLAVVEQPRSSPTGSEGGRGGGGGGGGWTRRSLPRIPLRGERSSLFSRSEASAAASARVEEDADRAAAAAAAAEEEEEEEEGAAPALALRSYFQSGRTGQRVWDEPPSGASNVVFATEEVRRMAEVQMRDLQVSGPATVRAASAAAGAASAEAGRGSGSGRPKVLGRFRVGPRKRRGAGAGADADGSRTPPAEAAATPAPRIVYKPGTVPYGASAAHEESAMERDTRLALALSISGEDGGLGPSERERVRVREEEEQMVAMAMAISLSEAEAEAKRAELSPIMPPVTVYDGAEGEGGLHSM
jgi:hypothetical protein